MRLHHFHHSLRRSRKLYDFFCVDGRKKRSNSDTKRLRGPQSHNNIIAAKQAPFLPLGKLNTDGSISSWGLQSRCMPVLFLPLPQAYSHLAFATSVRAEVVRNELERLQRLGVLMDVKGIQSINEW